jgi:hypothetical protein
MQEMHLIVKGKSDRMGKIFSAIGVQNQLGVAVLISDKVDFKPQLVRRAKADDFGFIREKIHQENTKILNIYVLNVSTPNFIKHYWT